MNTTLTIQEKLKDLRVAHGLTLEQLADQTGLSKSALGKYENDDYKDISPFAIVTLAKFRRYAEQRYELHAGSSTEDGLDEAGRAGRSFHPNIGAGPGAGG